MESDIGDSRKISLKLTVSHFFVSKINFNSRIVLEPKKSPPRGCLGGQTPPPPIRNDYEMYTDCQTYVQNTLILCKCLIPRAASLCDSCFASFFALIHRLYTRLRSRIITRFATNGHTSRKRRLCNVYTARRKRRRRSDSENFRKAVRRSPLAGYLQKSRRKSAASLRVPSTLLRRIFRFRLPFLQRLDPRLQRFDIGISRLLCFDLDLIRKQSVNL